LKGIDKSSLKSVELALLQTTSALIAAFSEVIVDKLKFAEN
jgi:hypothetical protein